MGSWADVGRAVAKVAPVLGTVLGGPVGAVAGAAGALVASWLGAEPEPDAVQAAIAADPQSLIRLKELEAQQQARLLDWQAAQLAAEVANTRDARAREVEMVKAGSAMGWLPPFAVSFVVCCGFFVMLYVVLTGEVAPGEAAVLLLGSLAAAFAAVVNYYLGSSLGSMRKDDSARARGGQK